MQDPRTSPTHPPSSEHLPAPGEGPEWKCIESTCTFRTATYDLAFMHNARTGHAFQMTAGRPKAATVTCRCGRVEQLRALYLCDGCEKPVEHCECTATAAPRPPVEDLGPMIDPLVEQMAAEARTSATLPDEPPAATLGDELETLAALLAQVQETAKRAITAGALNLGPCFTSSGLEVVLERALGSVSLHSKHLAAKVREVRANRARYVDALRDLAQKAQINKDAEGARWLAGLAKNLPEQLPAAVSRG